MSKVKINSVVTNKVSKRKIKIGDTVQTTKGCRISKRKVKGVIQYFSMWRDYPSASVKPKKGKAVMCLVKNLNVVK